MNIYVLNATLNGKLLSEILCNSTKIKGLITLDSNGVSLTNEYFNYTEFCTERGIECIKMKSYSLSDPKDRDVIESLDIDLIIVASWQRLVPDWFINHCRIGVIGAHGSHEGIERGRGRSPQNWALITDKEKFSLSIFWIEKGTDNGDVIDTVEFEYRSTDTILTSYILVNIYKAEMILRNLRNGRISRKEGTPQCKEGLFLPQRTKEDGQIDWNRDAVDVYNMVRALTKPYPGAYTKHKNTVFYIWIARPIVIEQDYFFESYENGTVVSVLGESILVKCAKNLLLVDVCSEFDAIYEGMVFESADYREQIKDIVERHNEKYGTPLSRLVLDELSSEEE